MGSVSFAWEVDPCGGDTTTITVDFTTRRPCGALAATREQRLASGPDHPRASPGCLALCGEDPPRKAAKSQVYL